MQRVTGGVRRRATGGVRQATVEGNDRDAAELDLRWTGRRKKIDLSCWWEATAGDGRDGDEDSRRG